MKLFLNVALLAGTHALRARKGSHSEIRDIQESGDSSEYVAGNPDKIQVFIFMDFGGGHMHGKLEDCGAAQLCKESWEQYVNPDEFQLNFLNSSNIRKHLPAVPEEFFHLDDAAKSDFVRAMAIAEVGGIYMDADIVLGQDLSILTDAYWGKGFSPYISKGQKCTTEPTTNFLMGQKGNEVSSQWYNHAAYLISNNNRCKYEDAETVYKHDLAEGVCCHTPSGKMRRICHIPWGALSSPRQVNQHYGSLGKMIELNDKNTQCIAEGRSFGAEDSAARMYWLPLHDYDSSTPFTHSSCWMNGPSLGCTRLDPNDHKIYNYDMKDFLKRDGYHLYRVSNGEVFNRASREDLLDGDKRHLTISYLFRNIMFGDRSIDTSSRTNCTVDPAFDAHKTSRPSLSYIHIPRTGGTTITGCTVQDHSVSWGVNDKRLRGLHAFPKPHKAKRAPRCFKQHVPPSLMAGHYDAEKTFCTVRDPYQRMISNFRYEYIFTWGINHCHVSELNRKLLEDLTAVKNGDLYRSDCHYLPQSAYVFGYDAETRKVDSSKKMCKTMLHTENLEQEFNTFAKTNGYGFAIQKKAPEAANTKCHGLTPEDLTPEVRALIEEIYADDFKLLGYQTHTR